MNPVIGLVATLPAEARALLGRGAWHGAGRGLLWRRSHEEGVSLLTVRSGMGMINAFTAARWLVARGVSGLASIGIAGGLSPLVNSGDMVLADKVLEESADGCNRIWGEDSEFVRLVCAGLLKNGLPVHRGAIVTSQDPVLTVQRKRELFAKTRALVVDMESAAVATAARESGLPFFAARTVCDTMNRTIPPELFKCINRRGRVRPLYLFLALGRRPSLIFALLDAHRDFSLALASLGQAWRAQIKINLPALIAS